MAIPNNIDVSMYADLTGIGLTAEQINDEICKRLKIGKYEPKRVFDPFAISFVLSLYRKDMLKEPPKPIKRSRYAQMLWNEGAGWNE